MKKALFLVIFIFSYTAILAQAPTIEWSKCFGGTGMDGANSIFATKDTGLIIAAYTRSKDGDVSGLHGGSDYWIIKLNKTGDLQWQKCFGGSNYEFAYSIIQTNDGGFVVVGSTESTDGDVSGLHGESDYWVIKLNMAGELQWQRCLGGSKIDVAKSVIETKDGNIVVAGYSSSVDGDVTGLHGSNSDYWIVMLNQSGKLLWQKCYGGLYQEEANSIIETNDGNLIVAGFTKSDDADITIHHGSTIYSDSWIVKISQSGKLLWQKSFGGTQDDEAQSIIATRDGDFVIAGYTKSKDGDVTGYHRNADVWIIRINQTGDLKWQKCFGGSSDEGAMSICESSDGNFVFAGTSNSGSGDVSGIHNNAGVNTNDYWIVKFDQSLKILWQKCLGGYYHENVFSMIKTIDGGNVIIGWTSSNDGDVKNFNGGDYDAWVVKLSPETAVNEPEPAITENISISPNPAANELKIRTSAPKNNLVIYNIYGQQVYSSEIIDNEITVDISGFVPGAYAVAIGSERRMFIKE